MKGVNFPLVLTLAKATILHACNVTLVVVDKTVEERDGEMGNCQGNTPLYVY